MSDVILPVSLREKGYRLVWQAETGSTNEDAMQAAREGAETPCWYVARQQQAGRGRHGRQWLSPAGNLYASLLLKNPCSMVEAPQLGFVTGIALYDALKTLTGAQVPDLALKWPNDVLFNGQKLVGLLLESQCMGDQVHIVIGCGINVSHRPDNPQYPVAMLHDLNPDLSLSDVFSAFSLSFDHVLSVWQETRGLSAIERFHPIRELWLERAGGIGKSASVNLPNGKINGSFIGIDALGRLELDTGNGIKLIDAGDLFFPKA
ncbi:biotin--[acetyl-CoA-carboxylase] ligase [Microvirga sp. W0021]|uniref:biotin--[biotin carboxyl-carrier protein] ligase n=1 Tax=Hohaiivirga grylli TaxID=3133970 RepID=A0ABV0BKG1_9HYPH